MPNTEPNKLIRIPIFDQMRGELAIRRKFEREMDDEGFKTLLGSSLDAYLAQNPGVSVSKQLNIEIDGAQAFLSGRVNVSALGAQIAVNVNDYALANAETPGRLRVISQKVGVNYSGSVVAGLGSFLVGKPLTQDGLNKDIQANFADPNKFIWNGISQQLPPGIRVTKYKVALGNNKFKISLESE